MNTNIHDIFDTYKQEVVYRTDRLQAPFGAPQLSNAPLRFEISKKTNAVPHGGLALIHQLAIASGLIQALNNVQVLKLKLPYYESDHLLNITYNFLCGGTAIEHIEHRRQDPNHLNMLGTHSIPDPTTASDFCRRYSETSIEQLQESINKIRLNMWAKQPKSFFDEAVIDMDGVLAPTNGQCKQGMDISYKGDWGYHLLIVSLANTQEILYVKNRSGNRPSHEGAHVYVDHCIKLLRKAGFKKIRFRGDTDFTQTVHLDRWDDEEVTFVFGIDAMQNLVEYAESLGNKDWERLVRPPKYEVKTKPIGKRENIKEQIVVARKYKNYVLEHEDVAEIEYYRPTKCKKAYRLIILRKTITVKKGQDLLLPETRYFFYLTNDYTKSPSAIVFDSNARCNQENLLSQLKSGMNVLSMPLNTLNANWVYLVCGCLAWSLKCWLALCLDGRGREERERRDRLLKMEFSSFFQSIINLPAQVLRSGRQWVVRLLSSNDWSLTFFRLVDRIYCFRRE